jgi:uncharacterized protein YggE
MPPGPLIITCTGSSNLTHAPELATIHLTISSTGPSPHSTAQNVTTTSAAIAAHLKTLTSEDNYSDLDAINLGKPHSPAPVSKWSLGSLSTGSWQPQPPLQSREPAGGGNNTNEAHADADVSKTTTPLPLPPRLYTASATMTATFVDFSALGTFTSHLASTDHVSIERIEWDVSPATKMSLERGARREAVKHAMIKAKDFADAVGKADFEVLEISDVNSGGGRLMGLGPAFRGRGVEDEEEMMRFRPEEVGVACEVVVKFDAA